MQAPPRRTQDRTPEPSRDRGILGSLRACATQDPACGSSAEFLAEALRSISHLSLRERDYATVAVAAESLYPSSDAALINAPSSQSALCLSPYSGAEPAPLNSPSAASSRAIDHTQGRSCSAGLQWRGGALNRQALVARLAAIKDWRLFPPIHGGKQWSSCTNYLCRHGSAATILRLFSAKLLDMRAGLSPSRQPCRLRLVRFANSHSHRRRSC